MRKIIDLSMEITDGMAVYPGDDEVKLIQTKFYDCDGYSNHRLECGMHVGTHMDAPMHMTDSKITVKDIGLDRLMGRGVLIDAVGKHTVDKVEEYENLIEEESIVLIHTAYDRYFGTEEYFKEHPVISKDLADLFIRKKVKAVCLDTPSPDKYPFEIHKIFLENRISIVENCINLDKLIQEENYEVFIIPLKMNTDGAMVRIFARIS
ncbi:cyclase family protein [Clostridium thermarum]|uniref:cyclase family protein n=1 Tax=Clostridium thermarum TaxID=1716543 RepID=UPI00111DB0FA|nr:cyclase family protein [Clostridium thermarum]